VSETIKIKSQSGTYEVQFSNINFEGCEALGLTKTHFLIDAKVLSLYEKELTFLKAAPSVLVLEANEGSKSLEKFPTYIEHLVQKGVRRDHFLVAIGGGVIQDITSFVSSILLRGVNWKFYPTTLLAQADSCIGSKSSINVHGKKNIVGTFTPPSEIVISPGLLRSLTPIDFRSGVGEMLKIHAIAGLPEFDQIAQEYFKFDGDDALLLKFIRSSLLLKKKYVESDEFDKGERLVLNYGHTFGHAIEAASDFKIPHGIAVTMGMDMANRISHQLNFASGRFYEQMHSTLRVNARDFALSDLSLEVFFDALLKDKKHVSSTLKLVLPSHLDKVALQECEFSDAFKKACQDFFQEWN
jgi:3-dehydroquinate synthase